MDELEHDEEEILDSYWRCSRQPLEILVFLLPFIVIYELCLLYVLRDEKGTLTNWAHEKIIGFFETFSNEMFGLSLPGIAVILVLLIWHLLLRNPWRFRWRTLGFMLLESIIWTVPLLVFSRVVHQFLPMAGMEDDVITQLTPVGKIAISIGAGLYEELVFRMLIIFMIHTILVDMLRLNSMLGTIIAVLVSAILFTFYHPLDGVDGTLAMGRVAFYMVAGLFFGVLFLVRGFGVVVAVHAFYDIVTMLSGD